MAENRIQALNIPMESKLSLSEVDDLVHNGEKPAFAEKNSITYQGIVRNAHISKGEGFLTTHGNPIVKTQLYFSKWSEWKQDYDSNNKLVTDAQDALDKANRELDDLHKQEKIAGDHLASLIANPETETITNEAWTAWDTENKEWLNKQPADHESPEWTQWDTDYKAWQAENPEPEKTIPNPKYPAWLEDKTNTEKLIEELHRKETAKDAEIVELTAAVAEETARFEQWQKDNPEPTDKESKTDQKIGTILTDKNGKVFKVPHKWLLKDSFQIENYTGGDIVSAAVHGAHLYVLFNDDGIWSFVVADRETKEIINLYQLNNLDNIDPCISATIGSVYNSNKAPTLWLLTKQQKQSETSYLHELYEIELSAGTRIKKHAVTCYPLGHKMTATDVTGYGEGKTVAFDDIDQEKRAYLRLRPGVKEPEYHQYYGTVSPAGIITGEPLPIIFELENGEFSKALTFDKPQRLDNATLAWNCEKVVTDYKGSKTLAISLLLGYDSNDKELIPNWKELKEGGDNYGYWVAANTSVNDIAPKDVTYPENDPRTKPTKFFISNFTDAKGVYYDWGQGWAKSYYRISTVDPKLARVNYMDLVTIGATSASSDKSNKLIRDESLIAKGKATEGYIPYVAEHLNERVYTVGGDNKGEHSILGSIPFSVDLLYQGPNDPQATDKLDILRTQVFNLIETSYAFKQTLITTPSEGSGDRRTVTITWDNGKNLTLFANGEVYEIIQSSDVADFKMSKIADYSFKLNVLDNKNLIKEDRDGNVSLSRAFIPYNMDCVIDVNNLKLTAPAAPNDGLSGLTPGSSEWNKKVKELYEKMDRDPNDAWFEGVGYNVNLDVSDPAMSFLLPKIYLPLWVSKDDRPNFKNEAIDKRNSILKPILRGSFLEDETVDTYFTLQNDSQDCTYKTTQVVKFGPEAEKAGWNITGKSTYDVLKKGMTWWMEAANTVIFPIGVGSTIAGVNFITPSAQLPEGYASRLYTNNNRLFLGFNYQAQIWHGATIFTIYGSNYYYDGQGIYFVGSDQDFTNNNFVTYALGMKFLSNSGSEAYFYSDFEKRLYVFTGSNTLQAADLLSNVDGTIVDAAFSSKEQSLYLLTSEGEILVRTQTDLCKIGDMNARGHLEGTTEGAAIVGDYDYKVFSPWKGDNVIPLELRTEHYGTLDYVQKLAYIDIVFYRDDDTPAIDVTCQTLNGIEKTSEKVSLQLKHSDWKGNTYRVRLTPQLNVGNAFDVGIYSNDRIGVQSITFYAETLGTGAGDTWQNNVVSHRGGLTL